MLATKIWNLCCVLAIFCLKRFHCFNLESRLPIVKYGDPDSYFGYSVATHIEVDTNAPDERTRWLLVGAPLGQNLQPQTNGSGALYRCPVTQYSDDCNQVITDGRRSANDGFKDLMPPDDAEEIKNGQWMGVTVRSQGDGGKILVCAHRYIAKESDAQHGQGLCYLLTNDFNYEDVIDPCKGRPKTRAHEAYGYCQAGTSASLFDDDTMLIGSPGPYTWRGVIFVTSFLEDYLKRDKTMYYSKHEEESRFDEKLKKYSYLGMAVTGGRYFNTEIAYAAGAPRSNETGQVFIFTRGTIMTNPMYEKVILNGEQFASSFGYELSTADVNGDSLPDLLVSAPYYFTRDDGGAVYVYQNENHAIPNSYTTKITGKLESHFGIALANVGDLNNDKCDDIAVGAPYEDDGVVYIYLGSRNGLTTKPSQIITVKQLGLLTRPIQTFGSSIAGGIDLDNNSYPDLLIGAYGSSAAVVLLARPIINIRTEVRSLELKNIDPSKQGCIGDSGTNLTCFSFQACCSIDPYESSSKMLELVYTIEAETFNNLKKFSRIFFGPDDLKKRSNILKRNMQIKTNGTLYCREEIVYVKENTRDIQSPIKFRLNYTLVEPTLPKSGLESLFPILDQTQADRPFDATFQKDCGTDDVCESQLEVYADLELDREDNQLTLILGKNDEIHLTVMVLNEEDSAYEAQLFVEHQHSVTYIAAVKGQVICNRLSTTIVSCNLGNPLPRNGTARVTLRFDPSSLEDSAPSLSFKVFANSTSKQIIPREKTVLTAKVVKQAELSIKGWALPEQSFYGGEIKGESAVEYMDDIGTSVQHTYQIYNDGPWKVPYLEVNIAWPHQVANDKEQGKWLLYLEDIPLIEAGGGGECEIKDNVFNPLKIAKGSRIRDFLNIAPEEYRRFANVNKTVSVNGKGSEKKEFSELSRSFNRIRRDKAMIIRAERLFDKDGKKTEIVHMDCEKLTAKCIRFKCAIYNMQKKSEAYIHVKARLWNSSLVSDYPRVDRVDIVSHAQIKLPDAYGILQRKDDDRVSVETRAYPELLDQIGAVSIPWWIYFISIAGGILLLLLMSYFLWKLGFFKRKRPDPTLSGNLEKNSENKHLLKNKT